MSDIDIVSCLLDFRENIPLSVFMKYPFIKITKILAPTSIVVNIYLKEYEAYKRKKNN